MHATLASQGSELRGGPTSDNALNGRIVGGKYRLGQRIGKGGRGEVHFATQIDLSRECAVKLVLGTDDEARERFLHEAKVAAKIRHPCVVEIYDAGIDADGTPYCAMELLEGETLASRIAREGSLPVSEVVELAANLASALDAVHRAGFLHRDVKPSNIFLARRQDGGIDPKLIDFGIAKRIAVEPEVVRRVTQRGLGASKQLRATAPGIIVGTPRYLSPEQILGGDLDARTDVYALGVTVYEALTGEPPWVVDDIGELLAKIVCADREPFAAKALGAIIPEQIEREVLRAIAKDRAERHASAGDFATSLWAALAAAKRGETSSRPPAMVVPGASRSRAVFAVALAAIAIVAAIGFVRFRRTPAPIVAPRPPDAATAIAPPAIVPGPTATFEPEGAPPHTTQSALPEPKAKGARAPAPTSRAPFAPTAAPPQPSAPPSATSLRIDDLKAPY